MSVNQGYTGKILRIDLSSGKTEHLPTIDYSGKFFGGRGIAAKIYWDEVNPDVRALDPENRLIFMTGPLAGFPSVGGSRWQISARSLFGISEQCNYSNLGGGWGAKLKFAGFDGLIVQGKADKPVYVFIDDGKATIEDASFLKGKVTSEARAILKKQLKNAAVLSIGPAGENTAHMATIVAENDSTGSAGLGAVMGSKNLKAIAVRGNWKAIPADGEKFSDLLKHFQHLKRYPAHVPRGLSHSLMGEKLKKDYCFGCVVGCNRAVFHAEDGRKGKFMCQAASFYDYYAQKYHGKPTEVPFHAVRLCDDYGICTKAINIIIIWLNSCYKAGILTEKDTGLPFSRVGSLEYIQTLLNMIVLRQDFGSILAQGIFKASEVLGKGTRELIPPHVHRSSDTSEYGPSLYLHTALLRATEPGRVPQGQLHEIGLLMFRWLAWLKKEENSYQSTEILREIIKRFWGSEEAADFTVYEGKALAAKKIQDREFAKESFILCDSLWPVYGVDFIKEDTEGATLESKVISAVTGKKMAEEDICLLGERLFNLQRAIALRDGHKGRNDDTLPEFYFTTPLKGEGHNPECLVPGKDGEVVSRKGQVLEREKFEKMKDEYYHLRGWDIRTGIPAREKMLEMGLEEIKEL